MYSDYDNQSNNDITIIYVAMGTKDNNCLCRVLFPLAVRGLRLGCRLSYLY